MTTFSPRQQTIAIPPLENGDRLSRSEFERRYSAMPEVKKAELIEGVVYMASPLRHQPHGKPHFRLITWLGVYEAMTPTAIDGGDNSTVRLDRDNEPQPDVLLRLDNQSGGRSKIDSDGYISGAPELIVEIAASTASNDLGDKLRSYRRNGVQEYIVWQVFEQKIDWFYLQEDEYVNLPTGDDGITRSQVFPGLWLHKNALIAGDMQQVIGVLQQGLTSPEHQAFIQQIRNAE